LLISHSHRFVFIHVPKVAGTSIQKALEPYAEKGEKYGLPDHAKLSDLEAYLPHVFKDYFKFAFVRNPWDYEVSMFKYKLMWFRQKHPTVKWKRELPFSEFLQERTENRHFLGDQCKYLVNGQGKFAVSFIGRYENLHRDFNRVMAKIGLTVELPYLNASIREEDYRRCYSEFTRNLVYFISRPEIEAFGYRFDPEGLPATPHPSFSHRREENFAWEGSEQPC